MSSGADRYKIVFIEDEKEREKLFKKHKAVCREFCNLCMTGNKEELEKKWEKKFLPCASVIFKYQDQQTRQTAIHLAARFNRFDAIEWMATQDRMREHLRFYINREDAEGHTPFYLCCSRMKNRELGSSDTMTARARRLGCAKLLLNMYADPTKGDEGTKLTPLHWCAINNDVELTSQILYWKPSNQYMVFDEKEGSDDEDKYVGEQLIEE